MAIFPLPETSRLFNELRISDGRRHQHDACGGVQQLTFHRKFDLSQKWKWEFHCWELQGILTAMLVVGIDVVERYLAARAGFKGSRAARAQYDAWRSLVEAATWKTPEDVKRAHPKVSILKGGRVVFNIKANDFRLIALVQYRSGIVMIRFFGSHAEYDLIDAETV